ncbi:hypothetical protein ACE15N_09290 [Xanthomonas campestris pv. passiflorae]|uniref:hypothetical protein n=1 Tax=Xanthomonas citri TaxID=346 RepID=UPI00103D1F92|nr:hypothetical protein [Xanthomonas citri]MCC8491304.1 hypothetical protein [Xanthomonas citri pv. fuscans]
MSTDNPQISEDAKFSWSKLKEQYRLRLLSLLREKIQQDRTQDVVAASNIFTIGNDDVRALVERRGEDYVIVSIATKRELQEFY